MLMEGGIRLALAAPSRATGELSTDHSAVLAEMIAAHQRRIFRVALRLLGDIDEASSATQDCFLRAYRAIERCPQDDAGRQRWLIRLVVNLSLDRLRSRKWRWWRARL